MSNIIKFPKKVERPAANAPVKPVAAPAAPKKAAGAGLLAGLVKFVWVATALVWPILKWVLSIMTFFQLLRMFYHWNTPGVYAGWSFLAYFAVLTAITYFVSIYKPKGL
nr:stable inheritance protein [uncultured bacterium]